MAEPSHRKRRGVTRASLTKLATRVKDLEGKADQEGTLDLANQAKLKLEKLDVDFKAHHFGLVDTIDEEATLEAEQEVLDQHDDYVVVLAVRIRQLVNACGSSSQWTQHKIALRHLQRLKRALDSAHDDMDAPALDSDDICLLRQYEEESVDLRRELRDVRLSLLPLNFDEGDDLHTLMDEVERAMFSHSLKIKKLPQAKSSSSTPDGRGVRLPKLEVSTFDGNILRWKSFWEQFSVSIHSRSNLADAEKLLYLQNAVKGGSARNAIEGLSRSGDYYGEAVECLQLRYNRPHLIHQAGYPGGPPPLKDCSGRELRRLHDVVLQHLRALKALSYEPSGPFITSVLEIKLDTNTMFEWQKHSQESSEVPGIH